MTYILILILGLIGIYKLRDSLLIIQNRRDAMENISVNIISNNSPQCKPFKQAG